jgi:hypothetical protein
MVFLRLPQAAAAALARGPFRFYTLGREVRLVCRADQEPEGIAALVSCVADALREPRLAQS